MNKLTENILKFLLEGKAYSDKAIIMNFGIDEIKLQEVYTILTEEKFLETYGEYEKRTLSSQKKSGCSSGCGSCSTSEGSCSSKECCNEKDLDTDNILVLTEKALNWF